MQIVVQSAKAPPVTNLVTPAGYDTFTVNQQLPKFQNEQSCPNPVQVLAVGKGLNDSHSGMMRRASGLFYTPDQIGKYLAKRVFDAITGIDGSLHICDPFAGDGRLIEWLLLEGRRRGLNRSWRVSLWDIHEEGIIKALERLEEIKLAGIDLVVETWVGDSFERLGRGEEMFDVVLTNPPWENLKPDSRELALLPDNLRHAYVESIRATALQLESFFPNSRARKKYGGWGTNLSRVGTEAAQRSVRDNGVLGIVLPLSFLADQTSGELRRWLLSEVAVFDVGCFPAEARPFKEADVGACTLVTQKIRPKTICPQVTFFEKDYSIQSSGKFFTTLEELQSCNHILPFGFGMTAAKLSTDFKHLPTFRDLENDPEWGLWAGREIDETRIANHLTDGPGPLFVKGRMIGRYETVEMPTQRVQKDGWTIPPSVGYERIVWRDVSRTNQKRRIIATRIPSGFVAGNSLGVAYLKGNDPQKLLIFLGLMSSLPFEIQLRSQLATGHVSLASLRHVRIPSVLPSTKLGKALSDAVSERLSGGASTEHQIEALAMLAYNLAKDEAEVVVSAFPKLDSNEREAILEAYCQLKEIYASS